MEKKYDLNSYEQNSRERLKYVIDHYCGGSQQRLAEMANVGKASISQYLNGKKQSLQPDGKENRRCRKC